jgi:hypothetical protein
MGFATVPNGYDLMRSNLRVLDILGDRYADLMLPVADGYLNRLTVFLAEDGSIQREKLGGESTTNQQNSRTFRADDPNDVAAMAERIASQLELDVGQIGLFGMTSLENGSRAMVLDEFGNSRAEDKRRMLVVEYAWPRREGEVAPRWGQGSVDSQASSVDLAKALTIVEQVIPEAFAPRNPALGTSAVVLTAKGEFIRTGHVVWKSGEPAQKTLQDQLAPGVQFGNFSEVRLTDKSGAATDVIFAWEVPLAGDVSP